MQGLRLWVEWEKGWVTEGKTGGSTTRTQYLLY